MIAFIPPFNGPRPFHLNHEQSPVVHSPVEAMGLLARRFLKINGKAVGGTDSRWISRLIESIQWEPFNAELISLTKYTDDQDAVNQVGSVAKLRSLALVLASWDFHLGRSQVVLFESHISCKDKNALIFQGDILNPGEGFTLVVSPNWPWAVKTGRMSLRPIFLRNRVEAYEIPNLDMGSYLRDWTVSAR